MWVFTTAGFISIVQDRDEGEVLQIRSREPGDIRATFPEAEVFEIDGADYRHRARVNREAVAARLAELVSEITYDSHAKDMMIASSPTNERRAAAYYGCWHELAAMQEVPPYAYASTATSQAPQVEPR